MKAIHHTDRLLVLHVIKTMPRVQVFGVMDGRVSSVLCWLPASELHTL